ncbi:MAG TPA: hypothetical protein PLM56_06765 [Cyclobacteriaceae bacterium]|jgi:hypothetical protein|nr:hypothetical protein [Cytophagales bacterium]HMR57634.1 hypothetical protein [Cyclobacteriaceae bacterium]HRE67007.1 hypothetical protein [Cyclobacteriaceae bacterium]HRF33181.1 hypothetical protein [Cyclobacteriaceae bacterium]
MKTILTFALSCLVAQAIAQPNVAEHRKQMAPLQNFVGKWHGVAKVQQPGEGMITINQEENVNWELDSLLLRIEGIGKDPASKKISFHAFAIISFNSATQQLTMRSYTHEGRQVDAYFKVLGSDKFEWGFDTPGKQGMVRYTITISDGNKWLEKGEYSPNGTQWMPFITMELVKEVE